MLSIDLLYKAANLTLLFFYDVSLKFEGYSLKWHIVYCVACHVVLYTPVNMAGDYVSSTHTQIQTVLIFITSIFIVQKLYAHGEGKASRVVNIVWLSVFTYRV